MRRASRAAAFASRFGACPAHRREAEAVHRALEALARRPLRDLDPDAALRDLLLATLRREPRKESAAGGYDVADAIFGPGLEPPAPHGGARLDDPRALEALLGPALRSCTWDPATLAVRSLRGVVEERVRRTGGCGCMTPR